MSILTQEFVFNALEQEKLGVQFSIDFNDVWQVLGYSRKDNAKRALKSKLIENLDFLINEERSTTILSGYVNENIKLNVEAFKMFCMMAETPEGREVRKYFIDIEKQYRKQLETQFKSSSTTVRNRRNYSINTNSTVRELEKESTEYRRQCLVADNNIRKLQNLLTKIEKELQELKESTQTSKLHQLKLQRDNYYDRLQTYIAKERIANFGDDGKCKFPRNFNDVNTQMQYSTKQYLFFNVMLKMLKCKEGVDYIFDGKKELNKRINYNVIKITEETYQAIITFGRSKKGMVATADTPREMTVKRSYITNHRTSKLESANTFQPKD